MDLRRALLYVLPPFALLAWVIFPLARGSDTLFLRDVFVTHLPMKQAQGEALANGRMPLVDPYRGLGQPLAGNLNAAPFYPDNLLLTERSPLWALNAHFWLHWLLAAPAMFWLGRAWGLSRRAAWAAGVVWAFSGYYLSQLNLYNSIACVTLTPAFVAACLGVAGARRNLHLALAGALWALLLLAGDPMLAALALLLGASALVARGWSESRRATKTAEPAAGTGLVPSRLSSWLSTGRSVWRAGLAPLAAALALGTVAALPQLVELARIVPGSFRAAYGYSLTAATAASFDPRQALEILVPLVFGRPDLLGPEGFSGHRFYGGSPPFYFSLSPGLLALALTGVGLRWRPVAAWWSLAATAVGLFFAFGRFNPLGVWLFALPGLRYPVKFFLPIAVGAAILAGLGFERLFARDEGLAPRRLGAGRAAALGAALLALHAASQLVLLAPLYSTDAALPYQIPSPVLDRVPASSVVVHGGSGGLFGQSTLAAGRFPEPRSLWLTRRALYEVYPAAGALSGRRFAFNASPEGLDSFWSRVAQAAVAGSPDRERLRLLAATGVDRLLLNRELPEALLSPEQAGAARLEATWPSFGRELHLYSLPGALGDAQLLGTVSRAADPDGFFRRLTAPAFDPAVEAVALGTGPALEGPPGEVRVLANEPERFAAEASSERGGLLVLRRAYLPLWRAKVDGKRVRPVVANFYLLGVEVPPGRHRVEVEVSRRPLSISLPLSTLAWLALGLVALRRR